MPINRSFIDDLCEYISSKTDFYYGSADTLPSGKTRWLKVGEIVREQNGVFAVADPAPAPDMYTPFITFNVSFWATNANSEAAFDDLQTIYDLIHQNNHYPLSQFWVFESFADGQIEDQDRSGDNLKLLRLSAIFYSRYLIS